MPSSLEAPRAPRPRKPRPRRAPSFTQKESELLTLLLEQIERWATLVREEEPTEMAHAALDLITSTYVTLVAGGAAELRAARAWADAVRAAPAIASRAFDENPFWLAGPTTWLSRNTDVRGTHMKWKHVGALLFDHLRRMEGHSSTCIAANVASQIRHQFPWLPGSKRVALAAAARRARIDSAVDGELDARRMEASPEEIGTTRAEVAQAVKACADIERKIAKSVHFRDRSIWTDSKERARFLQKALLLMGMSTKHADALTKTEKKAPRAIVSSFHEPATWPQKQGRRSYAGINCVCGQPRVPKAAGARIVSRQPRNSR